jgi:hypothetical protein
MGSIGSDGCKIDFIQICLCVHLWLRLCIWKNEEEMRECVRTEREREVESEFWTGLFVHIHSPNRFDPHSLSKPIQIINLWV